MRFGSRRVRIISVYVPHAGCGFQEFLRVFDDLQSLIVEAQEIGIYVIDGSDFNLSLGSSLRGDTMRELYDHFGLRIGNIGDDEMNNDLYTYVGSMGQ